MFDSTKPIAGQRCSPPGKQLEVELEMDHDGNLKLKDDSQKPSNVEELEIMLRGGHRNTAMQPVRRANPHRPIYNSSIHVDLFKAEYLRRFTLLLKDLDGKHLVCFNARPLKSGPELQTRATSIVALPS